jgi:predicted ATPase/DNA-binding SARP family transcriptional activator
MDSIAVDVLGPLSLSCNGDDVPCGGPLQRRLLAYLALHANKLVTSETLEEILWSENSPANPRATLHVYIANLRRILALVGAKHRLITALSGYELKLHPKELDLIQFNQQLEAAHMADDSGDRELAWLQLARARQLVRGRPLPDLRDVVQVEPELAELDDRISNAIQQSFELEIALGRHAEVLPELRRAVAANPFREGLWAALILGLYRSDRQEEALAACREVRHLLSDELAIDPGPSLQQLERDILNHSRHLLAVEPGRRPRARRQFDNAPVPLTQPIGRSADAEEIARLLTGPTRLVTVTGTGGIGKTTAAQLVAQQLSSHFEDGVCWVALAHLSHASQVAAAVANALGLPEQRDADTLTVVCGFLRPRQLLIVMDNFEHVLDAWPVIVAMLSSGSGIAILVTSRRALAVRGETDYRLEPLSVPTSAVAYRPADLEQVASVQLFVERGREANQRLALTDDNATAVATICRRLDGLPLAIELAAAQLRRLPASTLAHDLEVALASQSQSLVDLPPRQQTVAATLQWSYDLLTDAEREVFDRLGAFAGEAPLVALAAVCGASDSIEKLLPMIDGLRDHSMIRGASHMSPTSDQVTMMQPVREFARLKLASRPDTDAIRRRHAEFYLQTATRLAPQLLTEAQTDALASLRASDAELLQALEWATTLAATETIALRMIGALWHYWELNAETVRPCALADVAITRIPDACDRGIAAWALSGAATLHWMRGHIDQSAALHEAALGMFQKSGNAEGAAWSVMCCAVQAMAARDFRKAQDLAQQALDSTSADARTRVGAMITLGLVETYQSRPGRAVQWFQEAVSRARSTKDRWLVGIALANLADCNEQNGELEAAAADVEEVLQISLDFEARLLCVISVETLAAIELQRRRPERAARLFGAADNYRTEMALPPTQPEREKLDAIIDEVRSAVGPTRFVIAWTAGYKLSIGEVAQEITIHRRRNTRVVAE